MDSGFLLSIEVLNDALMGAPIAASHSASSETRFTKRRRTWSTDVILSAASSSWIRRLPRQPGELSELKARERDQERLPARASRSSALPAASARMAG